MTEQAPVPSTETSNDPATQAAPSQQPQSHAEGQGVDAPKPQDIVEPPPVAVPAITPLIADLDAAVAAQDSGVTTVTQAEVNAAIEAGALEAQEVAQASAKVDLQFPAIGFIDPVVQLEKMRRIVAGMSDLDRNAFPEAVRARIIAHAADKANPEVKDEDICLALYIRRTTDSALTPEEIEAKATGKKPKAPAVPKAPAKSKKPNIDDILGGI